jgi:hypothetical protein
MYVGASAVSSGEFNVFTDFVIGIWTSRFVSLLGLSEFCGKELILGIVEVCFEVFDDIDCMSAGIFKTGAVSAKGGMSRGERPVQS